jgi:BASS family bile acid:Na+ symporter
MGGRATTLLPFLLAIGLVFQNLSAAARPLLWPLAVVLLMLALARTDWARVGTLLRRPGLAITLALANLTWCRWSCGRYGRRLAYGPA